MTGLDPMSEFYSLLIYPWNHDVLFLSTSRGVISDREARQKNLGGEVLCEVW